MGVVPRGPESGTDEGNQSSNPFSSEPFGWIIVPLVVFVVVGIAMTCIRYRKHKRILMEMRTNPNYDLGTYDPRLGRRRPGAPIVVRSGANAAGAYPPLPEEGLNELGEAPPAYIPPRKESVASDATDAASPDTLIGTPISPFDGREHEPSASGSTPQTRIRLPSYDDAQRLSAGSPLPSPTSPSHTAAPTTGPDVPPPAFVSRR